MEQYIKKSALVAEIKKIRAKWFGINNDFADGQKGALTDVLSLINTLEVKGVDLDLEKELNIYLEKVKKTDEDIMFGDFARHFFELGMQLSNKAQKGEL